ncbi:MAG: hypothetical protein D6702_02800 [Planctomycetota bacterium]|nr:MAG: hypothetical protein D6702_02800 [Planctomycetota bacterium]
MRALRLLFLTTAWVLAAATAALRLLAPPAPPPPAPPPPAEEPDPAPALRARLPALAAPPRLPASARTAFALAGRGNGAQGLTGVEEVFPPLDFQASPQEGGIRLSWLADPRNPVEGLSYVVTRWAGEGEGQELPPTRALELLDPVDCEGIPYRYRIRAEVRRLLPGPPGGPARWETRSSAPAAASCTLPRRSEWLATGLDEEGRILLVLRRPGRPESGPHPTAPGEPVGGTGWFLDGMTLRETTLEVETRIPRFDAWGRRVIISGRPADRIRSVTVNPQLASIRLTDPCGSSWNLELLLPYDEPEPEGG